MSAETETPRRTAAFSAASISARSKRKITISIVLFARAIADSTGATPSCGWMSSFTMNAVSVTDAALRRCPMQHSRLRACSKVDSLQPARQARIRSVDVTEPKRHLRRADDLLAAHTPGAPAPGLRGPRLLILVVE